MKATRRHRLNRKAAEQLLRGRPAGPLADREALASLLTAAAAPTHHSELAGETAAVLAYRTAILSPVPRPRRPLRSATRLLAAKAVIAAVGVSGGGFALAAATGHLPVKFTEAPPAATGHLPANLAGSPAPASPATNAAVIPSASGKPASHPASSPSPSLRGLCQAYAGRAGSNPGRVLDDPAFSALVTAAGGTGKVAAFCTSLLATPAASGSPSHPGGKPSSLPSPASTTHPAGKPATVPASHPTGKPATVPTLPASHPTGKPATVPPSRPTAHS